MPALDRRRAATPRFFAASCATVALTAAPLFISLPAHADESTAPAVDTAHLVPESPAVIEEPVADEVPEVQPDAPTPQPEPEIPADPETPTPSAGSPEAEPPANTLPVWELTDLGTLTAGTPFATTRSAGPGTYTITAGTLPDGMTLDPETGHLTGTPTTAGPYDFTLTVIAETGQASNQFTGTITPPAVAPIWEPVTLSELRVNEPFTHQLHAGEGMRYEVASGDLPEGIELEEATGVLTGTPTTAGPFTVTITATSAAGTADIEITGTVLDAGEAPSWEGVKVGKLIAGKPHDVTFVIPDVDTFTITGGTLPQGLTLEENAGRLHGTPTNAGAYDFTVTATNEFGATEQQFTGTVGLTVPPKKDEPEKPEPDPKRVDKAVKKILPKPLIQTTMIASPTPAPAAVPVTEPAPPAFPFSAEHLLWLTAAAAIVGGLTFFKSDPA